MQKSKELRDLASATPWRYDAGNHQIESSFYRIAICDEIMNHMRSGVNGPISDPYKPWTPEERKELKESDDDMYFIEHACNTSQAKDQIIKTMHDALTKIAALNCNLFQDRCIPCDAKECLNEVNKIAAGALE